MHDHRKYHWLYFLLGFLIAVIVATLMGCDRGKTDKGRDCWGMAGMTYQGERCEVIDYPPTDPPGCWYLGNTEYCEPEPPVACCTALTPSCMAMCEGIPEDVWIENTCGVDAVGAEYGYWDTEKNEPVWLCQAEIID